MAFFSRRVLPLLLLLSLLACGSAHAHLTPGFYSTTCPTLQRTVQSTMKQTIQKDPSMAAAILRLFFHDCFVNGCDASVLLDGTFFFPGEKSAFGNKHSLRGFEVIDDIKARVEASCPATVSCADILALAARESVALLRGPKWEVPLGRKDARFASMLAANANLPPPSSSLSFLIGSFAFKGLSARDMTALFGGHTVGSARCATYRRRVYGDKNIDPEFAAIRRNNSCPAFGGDDKWAPLDLQTPDVFDNKFFKNLVARRGLLHSDQVLFSGGSLDELVRLYSVNNTAFFSDFAKAMVKLGNISCLTGRLGEIRLNCRRVN